MPELPEVETIRRGLEKYLVGDVIEDIEIRFPRIFSGDPNEIIGARVIGVRRYGKGLVIDLSNQKSLLVHVKMTGQLLYRGSKVPRNMKMSVKVGGELPHKHTHVIFKLKVKSEKLKVDEGDSLQTLLQAQGKARMTREGEAHLYYNDIRKFGWMKLVESEKFKDQFFFKTLGPEPLRDLTIQQFSKILKNISGPIKPLLMDQKKIAGIGNIYVNDALYLAKIHPRRAANSLSEKETIKLLSAIETVLKKGIEVGGASERNYVDTTGGTGGYQNFFKVYGKAGKPCKICGIKIERIVIGGRGTFFCPACQN